MQTIWIINQYATCPSRGSACRHFMLARELVKKGYKVTIIAGAGHYFHNRPPTKFGYKNLEVIEGVNFLWVRTTKYKQKQQITRGIAWIVFFLSLLFVRAKYIGKPKVVLHSSPSLIPFLASYFLSWRYKSKIFFEFRDVWPLTFMQIANYSAFHPIVFIQGWVEKFAIKNSDACLSSMEFGSQRLKELGVTTDKFYWLPNGVALNDFAISKSDNNKSDNKKTLSVKAKIDLTKKFVFGYVGTHGQANALDTIIRAAKYLEKEPIHIVFVGAGAERSKLMEQATILGLKNIIFLDSVSKHEVPSILQNMDALLISWHNYSIYKYGTSANKLAEYFAAKKPVVQAYSGQGDHVEKYEAGITVPAGDAKALSNAMIKIAHSNNSAIEHYSNNAQKAAYDHFTFESLANKFIKVLDEKG